MTTTDRLILALAELHHATVDAYRTAVRNAADTAFLDREVAQDAMDTIACGVKHQDQWTKGLEFLVYRVEGTASYWPIREVRDADGHRPRTVAPDMSEVREVTDEQLREWLTESIALTRTGADQAERAERALR